MSEQLQQPEFRPPEGLLSQEQYRLLAGPPLKVAAAVAASRNDPDLFHDMASMLALLAMVSALTRCYERYADEQAAIREQLDSVPIAVCALVFSRSGLAPDEVKDCLEALPRAYQMLLAAGALGSQEAYVEQAFDSLVSGESASAERLLTQAAHAMVGAVDRWEWQREEQGI